MHHPLELFNLDFFIRPVVEWSVCSWIVARSGASRPHKSPNTEFLKLFCLLYGVLKPVWNLHNDQVPSKKLVPPWNLFNITSILSLGVREGPSGGLPWCFKMTLNPFLPTIPTFAVRETVVSRTANVGTVGKNVLIGALICWDVSLGQLYAWSRLFPSQGSGTLDSVAFCWKFQKELSFHHTILIEHFVEYCERN